MHFGMHSQCYWPNMDPRLSSLQGKYMFLHSVALEKPMIFSCFLLENAKKGVCLVLSLFMCLNEWFGQAVNLAEICKQGRANTHRCAHTIQPTNDTPPIVLNSLQPVGIFYCLTID